MAVVTIPFNYDESMAGSIVPICMNDTDSEGRKIYRGWFEYGVAPVADPLREVAHYVLKDRWRVSEIAEVAVHSLWRTRRENLGPDPSLKVFKRARAHANDLRAGHRRTREKTEVELFADTLEALQDQFDLVKDLEAKHTLEKIETQLEVMGMHSVKEMIPMMLRDCSPQEFTARFGTPRNTLAKQFYRRMRRAARVAGITW